LHWSDGISVGIEPGDTLQFEVDPPDTTVLGLRTLILATKGYYTDFGGIGTSSFSDLGQFVNALSFARPNPMKDATTFAFQLREASVASLMVFDAAGRLIKTLAKGLQEAGPHEIVWDGTDDHGYAARAGVYFYRVRASGWEQQRKLVLLR